MKTLAALAVGALAVAAPSVASAETLNAAGASFPAPLYQAWFQNYAEKTGNQVNYQAVGSGAGVRQYVAGTTDFGASDKALSDKKIAKGGVPVVQIPMTGGAIAVAYNKPGCDLRITQTELVRVFYGDIDNWSYFGCAAGPISPAVRSDGSGTTAGFTNSLSAFSRKWDLMVGRGKSINWPAPATLAGKGNSGVAGIIKNTEGALGYVNYGYVVDGSMQVAAVQNRYGNFIQPNGATSAAGLSQIKLDSKLRGTDPNPAGATAYPIVSLTWILARPEYSKNNDVKDALRYMLSSEAQGISDSLGYVPLPEDLRQKSLAAVETLR
jgi:phosphate transport system substrate-binding protein